MGKRSPMTIGKREREQAQREKRELKQAKKDERVAARRGKDESAETSPSPQPDAE
jgi:hypothetical protein